jgi:uncharacterized RDD family membrane protein YckC
MTDRLYGGFWRRLVAYAIDRIILYFVSLLLLATGLLALGRGGLSLGSIATTGDIPRGMGLFTLVYIVVTFVTDMIYFTWFHGSVGQTPGKMLLGLRVIQTSGEKMTFGFAFLRWVGALVSSLFLFLGYLWIALDGRKQGWHDKIAATLVVRRTRETAPGTPPLPPPLRETVITGQTAAAEALPSADPAHRPAANPPSPPAPPSDAGGTAAPAGEITPLP